MGVHLPLGDLRVHSPPLGVFYNPKKTARPCLYRSCLSSLPFGGRGARSFSLRDTTGRHVSEDCYRVPVFFLATTLEPEAFPCAILPRPNYHATASCPFPITITTYPPTTPVRPRPHLSQPTPSPCRLETRDSLGLHRQWPDSGSLPPKRRFPTDRGQPYGMRGRDGSFGWRKVCQRYGCALRWGRLASPVSDVLWAGASPPPALFPKT